MTLLRHEMRQGRTSLIVWTGIIAFMLGLCILIYPEMATQMEGISEMFSSMGSFSEAFGMDRINFGEFIGFFGVECGNVLGLGGAFYAALLGISSLAGEEKEHTAEFLLTHPISRRRTAAEKLGAVYLQLLVMNVAVLAVSALCITFIGEKPDLKILGLLFLAYFILQLETASVCFGLSAFIRRGGIGLGLGLAALFYFMNIIANLTDKADFLKYFTPFSYTEGADIIANGSLSAGYLAAGLALGIVGLIAAFWQYGKKDIL